MSPPQIQGENVVVDTSEPALLTPAEAAVKLRVKPWSVTKLCRTGELRATKPGKSWLIPPAELDAYIEAHYNRPAGDAA